MNLQQAREEGVEVSIEAHTPFDREQKTIYRKVIPFDEFEKAVLEWMNGDEEHKIIYVDTYGTAILSPKAYIRFFPEFDLKKHSFGGSVFIDDQCSPRLSAKASGHWFVLSWFDTWLLGFRQDGEEFYDPQPMPSGLTFDRDMNIVGNKIFFPHTVWPWPWPLANPVLHKPYGRVNYLLQARDDNPITILCRSPQPYRGFGHMFKKEVEELKRLIYDSL